MQISVVNSISILILFQLVLLAAFLFTSKLGKRQSNTLLGTFFLLLAINIADGVLGVSGFYTRHLQFAHLEDGFVLLFGPILYFYTRSVTFRDSYLSRRDLLHAIPFVVLTIGTLVYYHTRTTDEQGIIERAVLTRDLPESFFAVACVLYGHILFYLVRSFHLVSYYRQQIRNQFSSIDKINLDWLVFLLAFILIILAASLVQAMIPVTEGHWFDESVLLVLVLLLAFITLVVWRGLKRPEIFLGLANSSEKVSDKGVVPRMEEAYIREKLDEAIKEKRIFLDPDLSLEKLASITGISPRKLSSYINEVENQNFFDFINSFRIEASARILKESSDPGLTVLEVMYQCGFNSKSSFNTVFKKKMGMTPSAFRKQFTG